MQVIDRCVGQDLLTKQKKKKGIYARILKYLDKTQFLLYRTTTFLCLKTDDRNNP